MSAEHWKKKLTILLNDVSDIIKYEDHDCTLSIDSWKDDGDAICSVGRRANPDTWKMVVTHMRDCYDGKPMLRIHHEGRHPFYVEADPVVLVELIS